MKEPDVNGENIVRFTTKELLVALEARVRRLETRVAAMYVIIPILTAGATALLVRGIVK